jgi:AcrR family transcriptional regulator
MTTSDGLTERQKQVIPYLVGEPSIEAACRKAKISKETIYRWLKESPAFVQALNEQREAVLTEALDRLKGAAGQAVTALMDLLNSDQETVRERAAGRILDYLLKVKEIESLRGRVEALERMFEDRRWMGHKT